MAPTPTDGFFPSNAVPSAMRRSLGMGGVVLGLTQGVPLAGLRPDGNIGEVAGCLADVPFTNWYRPVVLLLNKRISTCFGV